tara:strand:- start:974 stop:1255 length:282 start_codon:yes stop_codon:yes gene_type:complete
LAQYIVRQGRWSNEVAKFDDTREPLDVYTFNQRGCGCPARTRSCKHIRIVKAWEKADKQLGLVFDDNANIIGNMFQNGKTRQRMGLVERLSKL